MQYPIIDLITSAYINNGWTGLDISDSKNLLDINNYIYGVGHENFSIENDILIITGDTRLLFVIPVSSNTEYTFSFYKNLGGGLINRLYEYEVEPPITWNTAHTEKERVNFGASTEGLCNRTFTTSNNTKTIAIGFYATQPSIVTELQCELGASVSPYEPYGSVTNDFPNRLKLPLPHYFPHPVIDSLKRASDGTMTNKDREILTHYLTPLGIGGI